MSSADENKIRHLDFIQLTITRMAANSFLLKAWAVTLVAALFALSAKDSSKEFVYVAYLPVITFWLLDGFYLHQERLYRGLYDIVRKKPTSAIDFSMDTSVVDHKGKRWFEAIVSRTLILFYGGTLAVVVLVTWMGK